MNCKDKGCLAWGIIFVLFFNLILIATSVHSGIQKGDMMLRFREHETVTLFSGLFLGFTFLTSLFIYLLKKRAGVASEQYVFWLLSAIGFIYLCLDEYFMAHEGIDNWVGTWFGKDIAHLNLDHLVIAFYGLVALGASCHLRRAILAHKVMWPALALGAACLVGTIAFHGAERINMMYEVAEESFKILGVSFFFLAYFLALLTTLDRLKLTPVSGEGARR